MNSYPELSHLTRHAKHISRTFQLPLSSAQEIVAYQHACTDWSKLVEKSGSILPQGSASFSILPSANEIRNFKNIISPYINDIKKHLNPSIHIPGSVIDKIANGNFHHLPWDVVQHVLYAEPIDINCSSDAVIYLLEFLDGTFSQALARKNNTLTQLDIRSNFYGQRFYGYCDFEDKQVHILCREWDLFIKRPATPHSVGKNKTSICNRNWFPDYMLGFLFHFITQCRTSGYTGSIEITRIQNASVHSWLKNKEDKFRSQGIEKLFEKLVSKSQHSHFQVDKQLLDDGVIKIAI